LSQLFYYLSDFVIVQSWSEQKMHFEVVPYYLIFLLSEPRERINMSVYPRGANEHV